jgi:hypothetical protein
VVDAQSIQIAAPFYPLWQHSDISDCYSILQFGIRDMMYQNPSFGWYVLLGYF